MADLTDLLQNESESMERILASLMKSDTHISLKTDLPNPLNVAKIQVIAEWFEKEGKRLNNQDFKECAVIIRAFIKFYMEDMVSNKRMGRREIIEGVKARIEAEREKTGWLGHSPTTSNNQKV